MQVQTAKYNMNKKLKDLSLNGLTELQLDTIEYIDEFIRGDYIPPTRREIAKHYGVTQKAIHDRLNSITRKGFLRTLPKTSRGLVLTEAARKLLAERKA
ncbi:LexA family protein [Leptospira alexanderi]|uniref:LexA family protein n=1 Tax=Leptospira alexanderi TaxID=100053 RepID=UPI0009912BF4|nr:hypothetical protein [Leptospira alexanderi]